MFGGGAKKKKKKRGQGLWIKINKNNIENAVQIPDLDSGDSYVFLLLYVILLALKVGIMLIPLDFVLNLSEFILRFKNSYRACDGYF